MDVLLKVRWKVEECGSGPECWCRMVVPVEPVTDEEGRVWGSVIDSGAVGKQVAEHIVEAHNTKLAMEELRAEYLEREWDKYRKVDVIYVSDIQPKNHSKGVDVPKEVWDMTKRLGEERLKMIDIDPCCDENTPCTCNTFSPRMAGPGDWEAERKNMLDNLWELSCKITRIPKKFFGKNDRKNIGHW